MTGSCCSHARVAAVDCTGSPLLTHVAYDFRVGLSDLTGRRPGDYRAAGAVLHVHGPRAAPDRADRAGGRAARDRLPGGEAPDGGRPAYPHVGGNAGAHEGARRGGGDGILGFTAFGAGAAGLP